MKKKPKIKLSKTLRFTGFLTVLSLLGLIYSIAATFSFLIFIFYALIIILLALLTFFLVNYIKNISQAHDLCEKLFVTVPNVLYVVLFLCAMSILLLIIDKNDKNKLERKSRLIFNIVLIVISLLILAFHVFKVVSYTN